VVCIPIAVDHGLDSKLLPHFGSAPLFALVDIETRAMETLDNSEEHGHGGCAPVDFLAARRVEAIIVGGIGSGAIRRLAAYGIPAYKGHLGPISRLVDEYVNGTLEPCGLSDGCAGHAQEHDHGHGHGRTH
jgi:predicted Fe-Mo cluster-binding NifX family protein